MNENDRPSYTIVISGPDPDLAKNVALRAAEAIARRLDDGTSPYDVDVVEGTFGNPLSGDNINGLGRKAEPQA